MGSCFKHRKLCSLRSPVDKSPNRVAQKQMVCDNRLKDHIRSQPLERKKTFVQLL